MQVVRSASGGTCQARKPDTQKHISNIVHLPIPALMGVCVNERSQSIISFPCSFREKSHPSIAY